MSVLTISGPVARLDHPSVEGRQLSYEGLTMPTGPLPLMALHAGISPHLGHYGAEPVGTITVWDVTEDVLEVVGDVYDDQQIPAGKYVCGLDCRFDNDHAEQRPDERWPEGGLLLVRRWTPIAVTLHLPGSLGTNAWPDLPPLEVVAP